MLKKDARFTTIPNINEKINLLEETMYDTEYEIEYSKDKDAKVGHKTADTSFFGYKTHIAMTPERIITAATITTGVDIALVESLRYLADSVIEPEKINAKVLVEFSKTNKLFLQCDVTAEENNLLIRPFFFTRV